MTFKLSAAHLEVVELVMAGLTTKEIAERLGITQSAAHSRIYHVMARYGVTNRVRLALAIERERQAAVVGLRVPAIPTIELRAVLREIAPLRDPDWAWQRLLAAIEKGG